MTNIQVEMMKEEISNLESLHESEITKEQQERLNYLAKELELVKEVFDLYNA